MACDVKKRIEKEGEGILGKVSVWRNLDVLTLSSGRFSELTTLVWFLGVLWQLDILSLTDIKV